MGNLDEEKKLVAEERSYRLITVEPVLFIISLCYSSSLLLVDQYVFRVLSLSFSYKESSTVSNECNNQSSEALKVQVNVQSLSSIATLVFSGITAVLCLISSLLLGGYSDRRGRKLVLIICSVAHILKYIIAAVVLGFELSYWYLVIYSIMDGISGGFIVMLAVCFAYAADITDIRKLSLKVAILESCIGIGEGLGHFLSGYLITYLTFRFAFVLLIGLAVINLIYIVFFLPEPNIREKDTTVINMKDLLNAVQVFFSKDKLKIRPRILFLNMLLIFLEGSIFSGIIAPLTYFMRGQPLCFSPIYVGYYIGSVCIIRHIGVWIGVKLFGKCAGDYGLMILGAVSGIFYMTFITFLSQTWMVFVAPIIGLFTTQITAMTRAASSKMVSQGEQGGLFAGISCTQGLASLTGVLLYNSVYSATLRILPGFVFLVMAGVYLCTIPIIVFQMFTQKKLTSKE